MLLKEDTSVSTEVYATSDSKSKRGCLDFWVNNKRRWAIEFLIRGNLASGTTDRAEDHHERFTPGTGKYASLQPREYLLVDFRPDRGCSYEPQAYLSNYWIVIYNDDSLFVTKYDDQGKQVCKGERIMCLDPTTGNDIFSEVLDKMKRNAVEDMDTEIS